MGKYATITEALAVVKSGDYIVTGLGAAEGREFMTALHTIADKVKNVTVSNCLPMGAYEFMVNPAYKDSFTTESWFYTPALRKAHANGNVSFIYNHLHLAASKRLSHRKPDIYVGIASEPDKHGYVSLSLSNTYEMAMLRAAKTVILEVNPNAPRTFGDVQLHTDEVDMLVACDYPMPELPDAEPNEKDMVIGKLIADMIHDGDCIQLGIGGIPNAVAASLTDKKDLGVHTEMLTSGMVKLAKAGVITNKCKQNHPGKMVAVFAMGPKELYDFIDDNPSVAIMDGAYVNDPYVIAQNDNQVSINSTIEIDLFGQCCSESIGPVQFSGTGGQADTAIGAQMSRGGRSIIALYSTAMVKNKETGEREETSKIVSTLKPGAAVSLSRNDVDWLVTEYGAVCLRGTSMAERARLIISVAHPDFREQLTKEAAALGILHE
ncbi:MAG: 4-hydroxybutyrate--acetyl-CoA CoA transferase [Clostridia bacterium]|nr:4-hydroxybutyrate--acetyl-CoA CoA transferase [Clostridia bacterium]